ncbi:MAG TPA: TadE family protein [Polyangiaceae bacterium]|nr:TadE family protein [Polyangiaceae bacterium]
MKTRPCNQRGVATVEAVVVLPVFVIIFISLFYVRDIAVTKQAAEEHARTCAWLYSALDCEGAIPAGCDDVLTEAPAASVIAPDVDKAFNEGLDALKSGETPSGGKLVSDAIVPLVGSALEAAFGRAIEANTVHPVERPGLFGGGQRTVKGRYHLACNLHPTTPGKVAEDAWLKIRPW